jgi:hypothetical protein
MIVCLFVGLLYLLFLCIDNVCSCSYSCSCCCAAAAISTVDAVLGGLFFDFFFSVRPKEDEWMDRKTAERSSIYSS